MEAGKPLRGVIFDFDGTLLDSFGVHLNCWKKAFNRFELEVTSESILKNFGKSHRDMAYDMMPKIGWAKAERIAEIEKELFKQSEEELGLFPEVIEVLSLLGNRGMTCAIASSNPREDTERIVKRLLIDGFFSAITGADEVQKGKPHPDLILLTLERASIKSDEAIMVGDSLHDVIAGKRAGIRTMLVVRRKGQKVEDDAKPDHIVPELRGLVTVIARG